MSTFNEAAHPRGNAANAGQFAAKSHNEADDLELEAPSRGYATVNDLVDQEVAPSLDGAGPGFNTGELTDWMKETGRIAFDTDRQRFFLRDDSGDPDAEAEFSAKVADIDLRSNS